MWGLIASQSENFRAFITLLLSLEHSNPLWGWSGVKNINNSCVALQTGAVHLCPTCYDMGKMFDVPCSYTSGRSICEF